MTLEEIKAVIGEPKCLTEEDWSDLVKASANDSHEGAEMLPRYKVALNLLASAMGMAHGTLVGVALGFKDQPRGELLNKVIGDLKELWEAHLKICK